MVLNKYDKRGAEDALRDVRKQWKRNHVAFETRDDDIPVYPTIASQFNDPGVNWMFYNLCRLVTEKMKLDAGEWTPDIDISVKGTARDGVDTGQPVRYLADIAEQGRGIQGDIVRQADAASRAQDYWQTLAELEDPELPAALSLYELSVLQDDSDPTRKLLRERYQTAVQELSSEGVRLLKDWPERAASYRSEEYSYEVRGREITGRNFNESLSHIRVPKVALPRYRDWGDLLAFLMAENLPGSYPYTAGVYPYRRMGEDPARMFAGEGTPERTNRRFHYLSQGLNASRLSTAFDSVTLYGEDPNERAGYLRQNRQLRRVHCHAGRHEKTLFGIRSV